MLAQLYTLVVGTLVDLFVLALLMRFAFQWARVSFRNPIGQFVIAVTDWIARPVRGGGFDLASLLLAWLCQFAYLGLLAIVLMGPTAVLSPAVAGALALAGVVETLRLALYLAMGIVVIAALLSWINPYAPLAPLLDALAQPLLRPFQRFIPPLGGGIDLSPLVLLIFLQVLLTVLGSVHLLPWLAR